MKWLKDNWKFLISTFAWISIFIIGLIMIYAGKDEYQNKQKAPRPSIVTFKSWDVPGYDGVQIREYVIDFFSSSNTEYEIIVKEKR